MLRRKLFVYNTSVGIWKSLRRKRQSETPQATVRDATMNDPATLSDLPPAMSLSLDGQTASLDLGTRVQRLEHEVSALQDSSALEERVVERVTERLQKNVRSDQFTATPPPTAAREPFTEAIPPRTAADNYAWLFFDMFTDARLMILMMLDRRYTVAWTTHLVVWLFIPAILTSGWWFPFAYLPFFGHPLDKLFDLLLAFGVYKALSRELHRYREILVKRS